MVGRKKDFWEVEAISEGENAWVSGSSAITAGRSSAPPKVDERRGVARPPRTARTIASQDSCCRFTEKKSYALQLVLVKSSSHNCRERERSGDRKCPEEQV